MSGRQPHTATTRQPVPATASRVPDTAGDGQAALSLGGRPVAAVHGLGRALPGGLRPHWLTCFEVAGPDDVLDRLTRLGGQVHVPAHDGAPAAWPRWRTRTARGSRSSSALADVRASRW
ncbi:hypothetical protein [Streptomyces sp. NPDC096032]|uniref:hypothetical protein n=1 Tax=Streptomyces sp. NPDC096032 TaxID=3366070 RepID=UPI003822B541